MMNGYDAWLTYDDAGERAYRMQDLIDDYKDDIVCDILDDKFRMSDKVDALGSMERIDEMYVLMALHRNDPKKLGEELLSRFFWLDVSYIADKRLEKDGF